MNNILVKIGPLTIYWYSALIVIGALLAILIAMRESKKEGTTEFLNDLIMHLMIFGIIGARLYYVIFNFKEYQNNLLDIIKIWEGGLAIYGGIIAGFLTIVYICKEREQSIIKTTDMIVPGLILAQAIGRWGNFFNQEAYGQAVSLEFLQSLQLPKFIIDGMHINGVYYHPTFLYESIWCILGFIILIILRKITKRKKGIMTYTYFLWYGIGRLFIEGLRIDSLYLGTIRISQLVSLILIIVGLIGIIISNKKGKTYENKL